MSDFGMTYIVNSMAALSGIPVRLYENGELVFSRFPVVLPNDPASVYLGEILSISSHVGYFVTPLFHYYGVINAKGAKIVIGPTSQIMANDQELKELAFLAGVSKEDVPAFVNGMNSILRMPVETLLQMLCTMNHFLNDGEKLGLSDIAIFSDEQEALKSRVEERRTKRVYEDDRGGMPHNVLALENALMDLVRKGDVAALKSWLAEIPAVRGGTIAPDQLRQLKNTFIVAATLASRAAIRGGMREDDAFTLSDGYIQRVELLNDHSRIVNLQYNMILEFTEQVEKLKRGAHLSKLTADVASYIRRHLSEPISTERMAEELYMSRPYLSARFKKETGETLTDFILREKTEEAKRLLRWSDRSASAVAAYLGFSSHSHFIRVFKKYAGVTPNEWREQQ
ncbi:MAG: helix-turn-helix domain-containing protein [Clostridia bacterium]|nr:helix-turn-helix domain-containing protein [Clostridia bacterium]